MIGVIIVVLPVNYRDGLYDGKEEYHADKSGRNDSKTQ